MSDAGVRRRDLAGQCAASFASHHFRVRFVARGERATKLVILAVKSLARCHPGVTVVVVDANDAPALDSAMFQVRIDLHVVHVRPADDAVARAIGRGSRQHLFYWRHSPQLLGQGTLRPLPS